MKKRDLRKLLRELKEAAQEKKKKVKFLQVALKSQLTFKATRVYG